MTDVLAQPVIGHRVWAWTPGEGLRGMRGVWESGLLEAECGSGHDAPHWTDPSIYERFENPIFYYSNPAVCLCGVNAYKTHVPLKKGLWDWAGSEGRLPVIGTVELGGNVHEYTKGYRAQYGMIVEGTVITSFPISDVSELEEKYDAPFRVMSYEDYYEEWEATYGRDRETVEEDSDAETGAFSFGGAVPSGRTVTFTVSGNTAFYAPRASSSLIATATSAYPPDDRRIRKNWYGNREVRIFGKWFELFDLFMFSMVGLVALPLLLVLVGAVTDTVGWTTVFENLPTQIETVDGTTVEVWESHITNPFKAGE